MPKKLEDNVGVPTENDFRDAITIGDYMCLRHPVKRTDIIMGLGDLGNTSGVKAAKLWMELISDRWQVLREQEKGYLVYSGGEGKKSESAEQKVEADNSGRTALEIGVPEEAIILERESGNLGKNYELTSILLTSRGIFPDSVTVVHMPTSLRRDHLATKQWVVNIGQPKPEFYMQPADISLYNYFKNGWEGKMSPWDVISEMLGDFQRLDHFSRPPTDYQFPLSEPPPDLVVNAYNRLVDRGFTSYLRTYDEGPSAGRPIPVDFSRTD